MCSSKRRSTRGSRGGADSKTHMGRRSLMLCLLAGLATGYAYAQTGATGPEEPAGGIKEFASGVRIDWGRRVVEVDTARLLERHGERVTLSRINAGAVLYDPPKRGGFTFVPIPEVPFDEWRRSRSRTTTVAEAAVDYSVPDVADLTVAVWRADRDGWRPI